MAKLRSFRFLDDGLNRQLISLLNGTKLDHSIDEDGVVRYGAGDQELVENDMICAVRDQVFSSWQVLTCPSGWTGRYKDYMSRHGIPFQEELSDGEAWFLIPRKYRPHSWKLDGPTKKARSAKSKA